MFLPFFSLSSASAVGQCRACAEGRCYAGLQRREWQAACLLVVLRGLAPWNWACLGCTATHSVEMKQYAPSGVPPEPCLCCALLAGRGLDG